MLQGEWGDHIKWMFVPTAKDNRLLPPPVLMKQTFDGEWHTLAQGLAGYAAAQGTAKGAPASQECLGTPLDQLGPALSSMGSLHCSRPVCRSQWLFPFLLPAQVMPGTHPESSLWHWGNLVLGPSSRLGVDALLTLQAPSVKPLSWWHLWRLPDCMAQKAGKAVHGCRHQALSSGSIRSCF